MAGDRIPAGVIPSGPADCVGSALPMDDRPALLRLRRAAVTLLRLVVVVSVAGAALAAATVAALPHVGTILTAHDSTASLPELIPLNQRSVMYDAYGNVIAVFKAEENRQPIDFADMPLVMRQAIIAIEDASFYRHNGVNLRALIRATLANVQAGGVVQGGSTITQQLIKNALVGSERDLDRKIPEAMYALRLEKEMSKDEILERYLNTVYFGSGAYGVEAAAEVFFGKPARDLELHEAAFLAGLVRAPGTYDPFRNPERSKARRNAVLERMVQEGFVTERAAKAAARTEIPIAPQVTAQAPAPDTYFIDAAKQQLLDDRRLGSTYEQRYNALFKGGLQIFTTFDPFVQAAAEQARDENLPADAIAQGFTAAIAAVDPRTGAVRAMVGGPGFTRSQFNIATQRPGRQAGSSFKTFVLVAALEAGARRDDRIDGTSPCTFPLPNQQPPIYTSRSSSGGVTTLDVQISKSINCAFLRLGLAAGLDRVVDVAQRMGVTSPQVPANGTNITLSIGDVEVNPLEMAVAYGTLANGGRRQEPYTIQKVLRADGSLLFERLAGDGLQVITPEVAALTTDMLRGVVRGGTGRAAALGDRPVAGKTGTNDDYTDAWFVGYTPELSTAVWMGSPIGQVRMRVEGRNVTGGSFPAAIFGAFMNRALAGVPITPFPDPPRPARRPPGQIWVPGLDCAFTAVPDAGTPGVTSDPDDPFATLPTRFEPVTTRRGTRTTVPADGVRTIPIAPADTVIGDCAAGPTPEQVGTTTTGRTTATQPPPTAPPSTAPPSTEPETTTTTAGGAAPPPPGGGAPPPPAG
jgi:1A family penicillin-binding protein